VQVPSPDSQVVDALERRSALTADHRVAVTANEGIVHRTGAGGAVQLGGGRGCGG